MQPVVRFQTHNNQDRHRLTQEALTFDDVLIIPAHSEVMPLHVDVTTRLTRHSTLNIPLLTAAMDTVTESRMAIAMAKMGGLGVIHKNLSVEEQCQEVQLVKRHEMMTVTNPVTVDQEQTLREVLLLRAKYKVSGFPVVDSINGRLLGVLTNRDTRFIEDQSTPVRVMMTKNNLITIKPSTSREEILALLRMHRLERLLVVDDEHRCVGLVTARDVASATRYPKATKDNQARLRVGAAVGPGLRDMERVEALVTSQCDILVVDTAHGHSQRVIDFVRKVRQNFPDKEIIAGNVATAAATKALIEAGADAVKVGIGPGSICITRVVAGVGVPQLSAIMDCAHEAQRHNIPIIADGGLRHSGDLAKAVVAGADTVMVGSMLAGTHEAPGEIFYYQGRPYKAYRGMGSAPAMEKGSAERYFQDPGFLREKTIVEGVEGRVAYKGQTADIVEQIIGGLKASMGYAGQETIVGMQTNAQFCRITSAGVRESHHHDIELTRQVPHYIAES